MKIDFGMGEQEIDASFYALVIYENYFHADMIQDVFGRLAIKEESKADDEVFVMDFRDTNWTALTRALWACLKVADDSIDNYDDWAMEQRGCNLYILANRFLPYLQKEFFRTGVAASE